MDHICICVATFQRKALLEKLINAVTSLETDNLFTYSMVIAGNIHDTETAAFLAAYIKSCPVKINHIIDDTGNIVSARNKCLEAARGDYLAFIDDDEYPDKNWLLALYQTILAEKTDAVGGTVLPYFENKPKLSHKILSSLACGMMANAYNDRLPSTNNCLIRYSAIAAHNYRFDKKFAIYGGEDSDLFLRMRADGCRFSFAPDAVSHEHIPLDRQNIRWYFSRFYRFGCTHAELKIRNSPARRLKHAAATFALLPLGLLLAPLMIAHTIWLPRYGWIYFYRISCFIGNIGFLLNIKYAEYAGKNHNKYFQ